MDWQEERLSHNGATIGSPTSPRAIDLEVSMKIEGSTNFFFFFFKTL